MARSSPGPAGAGASSHSQTAPRRPPKRSAPREEKRSSSGRIRSEWRAFHETGPGPQDPRDPRGTGGGTPVSPGRPHGGTALLARTGGGPPPRSGGGGPRRGGGGPI